jgi:hypothetical protein
MDTGWWYATGTVPVDPNRLYRLSYWVRHDGRPHGGEVLAGLNLVNRPVVPDAEWKKEEFFFRSPLWMPDLQFWLGQRGVKGTLFFDGVALNPAVAVHRTRGVRALMLGAGESIVDGRYTAVHRMSALGTSDCRFLHEYGGRFDGDRWVLDKADEVVFVHKLVRPGVEVLSQTMRRGYVMGDGQSTGAWVAGKHTSTVAPPTAIETEPDSIRAIRQDAVMVEVAVARCEGGRLNVSVSRDGKPWTWVNLGDISEAQVARFHVPLMMLPSSQLFVRLKSDYSSRIEVTSYRYTALLHKSEEWLISSAFGSTQYLAVLHTSPELEVQITDLGDAVPGGRNEVRMIVHNQGARRKVRAAVHIVKDGEIVSESADVFPMDRGSKRRAYIPYAVAKSGDQQMRVMVSEADGGKLLLMLEGCFQISPLADARGGELLSEAPGLAVWWCEPERKVGRFRPSPEAKGEALFISAAGNEYEAAQLVLRPDDRWPDCQVTATDLTADSGAVLPASEVEVRRVGYLPITKPSDGLGQVGEWPDPLLPAGESGPLRPGRNHPFWIGVHVPAGTQAGDYRGELLIQSAAAQEAIPFVVHVWGFDLPDETHVKASCGLSPDTVRRYHNLASDEDLRQVIEAYLGSFSEHRVTRFCVTRSNGLQWEETAQGGWRSSIDFSLLDREAAKALQDWGFDGLAVWLAETERGVPRVTTSSARARAEIDPQDRVSLSTYVHALQEHLETRGWLHKAHVYWFAECGGRGYELVKKRLEHILRSAPKLGGLLASHPDGNVYQRLGLLSVPLAALDAAMVRHRRQEGEEMRWHLCNSSRAPYLAGLIDHHGTAMRVWLWATWKYGLDGIVVWQADYWHSDAVYPGPRRQNPWEDPMSWGPEDRSRVGARGAWGNGDGRLLYPPNWDPERNRARILDPAIPSIRWELLRDGIEDFEYFHLLRQEVDRLTASGVDTSLWREAEALLEVPEDVYRDLTHFATEPGPIHRHRSQVAMAIERLRGL